MYERHVQIARNVLFPKDEQNGEQLDVTPIEIEGCDGKVLSGVLVGKSVIIPLSTDPSSDTFLNGLSQKNRDEIGTNILSPVYGACRILDLPYAAKTDGIYADSDSFGTIVGLHLHPNGSIITQEEFITKLTEVLSSRGAQFRFTPVG